MSQRHRRVPAEPFAGVNWGMVARAMPDHALSLPYYPEDLRPAAAALMALVCELRTIPAKVSEPLLGVIRLQWWRDAMDEVFVGNRPRAHPIVIACASTLKDHPSLRPLIDRMIDDTASFLMPEEAALLSAEQAAGAHDGALVAMLAALSVPAGDTVLWHRLGSLYGRALRCGPMAGESDPVTRAICAAVSSSEAPGRRLAQALAALGRVPPSQTPVLSVLKLGVAYEAGRPMSEFGRRARQFVTVLRGK